MGENIIGLENASSYLTKDELVELSGYLAQNDIQLITFDNHFPKASLNDITIFINAHLAELMLTGFLIPATYDIIKSTLKTIIFKMRGKVKILQSGKIRDAVPCLKFKTKNGEINVPIPLYLSDKQFEVYMDGVKSAIETITPNLANRNESFIIEQNEENLKIEAKTMLQYAQEQCEKQKNK